jgi:probable phosphoglycerate mutase
MGAGPPEEGRRSPRLLLVRHGETALNAARILQPADTPLSARGAAQAQALGRRLAREPIAAIWSSDLPRALQTAEALGPGRPLVTEPLLQERNFGDLRGRAYDALGFDPLTGTDAPPGGESLAAFEARIDAALLRALHAAATLPGALLLVTHGLVIASLLARRIALPHGTARPARIGNTSLSVIELGPPPRATLVDCTAHLDATRADDPHALSGA